VWLSLGSLDVADWHLACARQQLGALAQLCEDPGSPPDVQQGALALQFHLLLRSMACAARQGRQVRQYCCCRAPCCLACGMQGLGVNQGLAASLRAASCRCRCCAAT
jgi:hypothetical protein